MHFISCISDNLKNMVYKIVALSAVLAVAAAGLLPAAHYSPVAAVSSQSIVRHDEAHPVARVAHVHAAPVAQIAAPVAHVTHVAAPVVYAAPRHYAATPALYAPITHAEENISKHHIFFGGNEAT
ncbi:unnamed protein product [Arctia plantaginis]|uniref:Uncharacterized protein n=1 Tax=Arctia plantaginis TaxID=874455 RepID=A0A8S1ACY3_ARCPL|nr:unnamed protein product [Arctia plantaginis]